MTQAENFIEKYANQWTEYGETYRHWKHANSVDEINLHEEPAHLIKLMDAQELPWMLVFADGSFLLSTDDFNMFQTLEPEEVGPAIASAIAAEYEYISEAETQMDDRQRAP